MADWSTPFDVSLVGRTEMLVSLPTKEAEERFAALVNDDSVEFDGKESFLRVLPYERYGSDTAIYINESGEWEFCDVPFFDGDRVYNDMPRFTVVDNLLDFDVSSEANLF